MYGTETPCLYQKISCLQNPKDLTNENRGVDHDYSTKRETLHRKLTFNDDDYDGKETFTYQDFGDKILQETESEVSCSKNVLHGFL